MISTRTKASRKATTAAKSLTEFMTDIPWFTAVGVGSRRGKICLYVYVKSVNKSKSSIIPVEYFGYPVIVKKMKSPRTCTKK